MTFNNMSVMLPWLTKLIGDNRDVLGNDWWPYGIEANRAAIDAVLRYHYEQALTKRRFTIEEVFVPGEADAIRIPRTSEALYLLQRIRDEAHRFAITYHRQLRGKRMTTSVLDDIPGLGPARRKRLLKELGGVKAVKEARLESLTSLAWLPDAVARAIHDKIHTTSSK